MRIKFTDFTILFILLIFSTSASAHTTSYDHVHTSIQWFLIIVTLIASICLAVKK